MSENGRLSLILVAVGFVWVTLRAHTLKMPLISVCVCVCRLMKFIKVSLLYV